MIPTHQVEVGRSARDALAGAVGSLSSANGSSEIASDGSSGGESGPSPSLPSLVFLSPNLDVTKLPRVIDTVKTVWPLNTYKGLPPGEARVGSVVEFTLKDSGTGVCHALLKGAQSCSCSCPAS